MHSLSSSHTYGHLNSEAAFPHLQFAARFVSGLIGHWSWPSAFALANRRRFSHDFTMQSHELLREVFQKGSAKQAASELGLSLSMIYKWAEPPDPSSGSGAANPLDRIEALQRCTGEGVGRSEEHTSELQSHSDLVCRLLLEKKKKMAITLHECPRRDPVTAPVNNL